MVAQSLACCGTACNVLQDLDCRLDRLDIKACRIINDNIITRVLYRTCQRASAGISIQVLYAMFSMIAVRITMDACEACSLASTAVTGTCVQHKVRFTHLFTPLLFS
jgi:hypothetical protein